MERRPFMETKVIVLSPVKVVLAGALSALLAAAAVLGVLALWGALRGERARAQDGGGIGASRWYFAEGYTGPGFEEWLLLFNPPEDMGGSGEDAQVAVSYYGPEGKIAGRMVTLWAGCRVSLNVKAELAGVGYSGDVSIAVRSSQYVPIICERAMYYEYHPVYGQGAWTGGSQSLGFSGEPVH